LDAESEGADVRRYIYPCAYLLTKFELHEIFNIQDKKEAEIEFGISKSMDVMISSNVMDGNNMLQAKSVQSDDEVYNSGNPCPSYCDDRSLYSV